ncbi:MAG: ThuA domain-containing protein [Novosphingobium sp.]
MIMSRLGAWLFLASAAVLAASSGSSATADPRPAKRVLLLTHNLFYNHDNLADIESVLPQWGETAGFDVVSLEGYKQTAVCERTRPCSPEVANLSMIDDAYLARFDAIVASTNGELPLTPAGREALVRFVRRGKGILFLHQSMVTLYGYRPWGELLGAYADVDKQSFDVMNMARRPAVLKRERPDHPAVRMLPAHWTLDDEFASFAAEAWDPTHPDRHLGPTKLPVPLAFSRRRVNVVLSFDSERTDFNGAPDGWNKGGDYPVAWYQQIGRGRTFYTSLGHRRDLWTSDANFRAHVTGAIRWLLRLE